MQPVLSIVMASYDASATIARALGALTCQSLPGSLETLVVDSSVDDTAAIVAREFPAVRLLRSDQRLYAGDARHRGVVAARGRILAFVDADCVVAPDWAERVVRAHDGPHPIVGGVVENGNPESAAGWAYYFAEFHHWLPGQTAGFVAEVPGCTMTIERGLYDRFGPFLAGAYCSDTDFVWRLAAAGIRPWLDPSIRVAHLNPTRLAATLRHAVRHGTDFGRLRARRRLSRAGAAAHALAAPLLPALLYLRAARTAVRRPDLRLRFLAATPRIVALLSAWSAGELKAYAGAALRGAE